MASAVVSFATATDHTVVAAPGAGKFLRVYGFFLAPAAPVVATWKSAATAKSGAMTLATPLEVSFNPNGWFDCGINEALVLTLESAIQVSGTVSYQIMG